MRVNRLYIVTKPTDISEVEDIYSGTDAAGFVLQVKGGLEADEIHSIYTNENEARAVAEELIAVRDAMLARIDAEPEGLHPADYRRKRVRIVQGTMEASNGIEGRIVEALLTRDHKGISAWIEDSTTKSQHHVLIYDGTEVEII